MATSKSLRILALAISISSAAACQIWEGPIYKDIPGTGLGGKNVYDERACQQHCVNQGGSCRAAQFCGPQGTCGFPPRQPGSWGSSDMYNCYIYASQAIGRDNLRPPVSTGSPFRMFFYNRRCGGYGPGGGGGGGGSGDWSGPVYKDIQGTGLGGSYEANLYKCKEKCRDTPNCQSAQYGGQNCNYRGNCYSNNCRPSYFPPYGNKCNCYLYARQNADFPILNAIRNFKMYYYYRNGNRNGWGSGGGGGAWDPWGGRRLANSTDNTTANTADVTTDVTTDVIAV